jgi:predicted aspartyl protease
MRGVLLLSLLLSGCSAATQQTATQCTLDRTAELPMAPGSAYAIVPAKIDGQLTSLLLDTGDERLTISPTAARDLRLPEDTHHRTTTHGVGGDATSFDAVIQRLEFGDTEIPQSGAAIADFPIVANVNPPLSGIMGAQLLSGYDVELDFKTRHVILWQRSDCESFAPNWAGPYTSTLLARTVGSLATLDVIINGQPVRALLDTGARHTTIGLAAASRLGFTGASLAALPGIVSRGSDGRDVVGHVASLPSLDIGGLHHHNIRVVVAPTHIPFADMLLGVDAFQGRDLWISYAGGKLFIR